MENEPRGVFHCLGPYPRIFACRLNRIGVAVERMDGRAGIEQAAGIAARAEGRVDHQRAGHHRQRGDRLVEQDRDMGGDLRGRAHGFFALASACMWRQASWKPSNPAPILYSSSGANRITRSPAPWK